MKNRNGKQLRKRGCAVFFAAALFVAGIGSAPIVGEAAPYGEAGSATYEDEILYKEGTAVFQNSWNAEGTGAAPTEEGYVFGGWCTANGDGTYTMLTKETAATAITNSTEVYAKYVPAYVLSVRGQVDTQTYTSGAGRTESGSIRLVSATDSKEYQKVGFDVRLGSNVVTNEDGSPLETNQVYNKIATPIGTTDATAAFGAKAKFLSVWKLTGIANTKDEKIMKVTPYWITLDGTKVLGLTKYVHMEDGYESHMYVSVPITLSSESSVAAGMVTVTYPEGLELIGAVNGEVEDGDIFPAGQMNYECDTAARTIQFVANTTDGNEPASGLYANLRFKKTVDEVPAHWEFTINGEQFCNWKEEDVSGINAWDIQY